MVLQQKVTVTRNSNGSADLRPTEGEGNPLDIDRVELHTASGLALGQFLIGKDYTITVEASDTQAVTDEGERTTARRRLSDSSSL